MPHFLTFTPHRVGRLAGVDAPTAADIELQVGLLSLADLRRAAAGDHATEAEALDYARREGPAFVLRPDGTATRVERLRDAAADARVAREEAYWTAQRPARRIASRGEV